MTKPKARPDRRTPLRIEAERLVTLPEMQGVPSKTLARRLAKEFKTDIETARSVVRLLRGARGKRYASMRVVDREHGKPGQRPVLPESHAEEWTPFELECSKLAVLSDIHMPYHSVTAVQAAVKHCKRRRPDCLLLNGDMFDFYQISRWIKDPRKRKFKFEMDAGAEFSRWIRSQFPKARIIFKKGNHEERWDHYLWSNAVEICDHPHMQLDQWMKFDDLGIEMVEDQRPIMVGHLPIFHGHELGKSIFSPVNPARGAFLRTKDTVLVGHSHQTSNHTESNWKHEEVSIWSTGCLCGLTPEYARVNKWNHGFAFIQIADDGSFDVENMRISSDGKVRSS